MYFLAVADSSDCANEDSSVFGADESESDVLSTASEMSTDDQNVPRKRGRPMKVKRGSCPGPGRGHKKLRKQNDSVNRSRHAIFQLMLVRWIRLLPISNDGWKRWVLMTQT